MDYPVEYVIELMCLAITMTSDGLSLHVARTQLKQNQIQKREKWWNYQGCVSEKNCKHTAKGGKKSNINVQQACQIDVPIDRTLSYRMGWNTHRMNEDRLENETIGKTENTMK